MKKKIVKIPGFPEIDKRLIERYLQNDLDDDWFQDPIRYSDFISLENEIEVITANAQSNLGKYKPIKRDLFFVPKPNFTLRYSLETDYYERWLYFFLVLPLIRKFDSLLPHQVFSHRYNEFDSRYLFHNSIQQWEKFEGIVRYRSKEKNIVEADIQNYYENISIDYLRKDLESCLQATASSLAEMKEMLESINCLYSCLIEWSYDSKRGIPQNRDCSSFLANIYMLSIDNAMLSMGFDYYRYMDDIKIVCDDKFMARRALKALVNLLRDKQLSVNSKKTRIIEIDSDEHKEILKPKFDLKSIDLLLRTKRKANVAIGYSLLMDLIKSIISKKQFDTKDFRFCITRMSKLARCNEYKLPTGYFTEITDGIIDSLFACPSSTDRAYEFLCSVKLSDIQKKRIESYLLEKKHSIYEWQNYWLWKLLIIQEYKTEELYAISINALSDESYSDSEKSGMLLYLASFDNEESLIKIKDTFSIAQSIFLQRHELLSLKNLDWKKHVQSIVPNINNRLVGTYRIIKKEIKNIVMPPPPTKIKELLESIHQYD